MERNLQAASESVAQGSIAQIGAARDSLAVAQVRDRCSSKQMFQPDQPVEIRANQARARLRPQHEMREENVVACANSDLKVGDGCADRLPVAYGAVYRDSEIAARQKRAPGQPDEKLSAGAVAVIGDVLADRKSVV